MSDRYFDLLQTSAMEHFAKTLSNVNLKLLTINYSPKKIHLRCFTGSRMCLCSYTYNTVLKIKIGTSQQAGHILDLYCIQLSNTAPFCENYTKLYFDAKHLEKGLNKGG